VNEELHQVLFFIDIGVEPEGVHHLHRTPELSSDAQVFEVTGAVKICPETPGITKVEDIGPPATAGDHRNVIPRPHHPLEGVRGNKGEISHHHAQRLLFLGEERIESIV